MSEKCLPCRRHTGASLQHQATSIFLYRQTPHCPAAQWWVRLSSNLPPVSLPTSPLSSLFTLCMLQAPPTSSLYPTLSTTHAVWSCIYRRARKTLVPTCYWSSHSRSFLSPVSTSFVPRNNSVSLHQSDPVTIDWPL